MKFGKKNRAVQLMAGACIIAILLPSFIGGLFYNLFWLVLLLALIFIPVLFLERRMER